MADPTGFSMNESDTMQKYMLLSAQQEVLQRRLSLHLPSAAPMTATSPEFQSLSSSPTSSPRSHSTSWSPEPSYSTLFPTSTQPISAMPGSIYRHRHSVDESQSIDSHKLCMINQQIKATLTELLNTESVRSDEKYRSWVLDKLMDAEQQIRKQRRRHSSGDKEMAASIATHFGPAYSTWR